MEETMKISLKHSTIYAVLLLGLAGTSPGLGQEETVISGSSCNGANLNQALKGLGTNQFGITNNGSQSFFVVCPIDGLNFVLYDRFVMTATFPASGGDMTCVLRFQNFTTGSFTAFMLNISSTGTRASDSRLFGPIDVDADPNTSVVCPLDPGEGVEFLALEKT